MKDNKKEPKLTYALDPSGKMVYIGRVERGKNCNCRCPKCNEPLIAKHGNERGRQPHFAHDKGSNCHGAYMSALHKLSEQIIEEEKAVMAPAYKEIGKKRLSFKEVKIETRVERKDLQPDIVGITEDGLRWFVEIRNTHEVDETKKNKLIESEITCLEIDVREQTLDNLKSFLLESVESREWINNPNYDRRIAEPQRKRVSQVEKLLKENQEITIPSYGNLESKKIIIKDVSVLSRSDDGLLSRIKVISSDSIPYIFRIGSYIVLKSCTHSEEDIECDELTITTDHLFHNSDDPKYALDIQWLYHYATEIKRKERISVYDNDPKFENRPMVDCNTVCEYRPLNGKCIYKIDEYDVKGINYIVCNKYKRLKDKKEIVLKHREEDESSIAISNQIDANNVNQEATASLLHRTQSDDCLPFEMLWTINDYYNQLLSTGSYITKKGITTCVIKCNMTNNGILVLYKDPDEVKTYLPFHIDIVSIDGGKPIQNTVSGFSSTKHALQNYNKRLSAMGGSRNSQPDSKNDMPF